MKIRRQDRTLTLELSEHEGELLAALLSTCSIDVLDAHRNLRQREVLETFVEIGGALEGFQDLQAVLGIGDALDALDGDRDALESEEANARAWRSAYDKGHGTRTEART